MSKTLLPLDEVSGRFVELVRPVGKPIGLGLMTDAVTGEHVVEHIALGSLAATADLTVGDRIHAINGTQTASKGHDEVLALMRAGKVLRLIVLDERIADAPFSAARSVTRPSARRTAQRGDGTDGKPTPLRAARQLTQVLLAAGPDGKIGLSFNSAGVAMTSSPIRSTQSGSEGPTPHVVDFVARGSPAERANLHVGDAIVELNGASVTSVTTDALRKMFAECIKKAGKCTLGVESAPGPPKFDLAGAL